MNSVHSPNVGDDAADGTTSATSEATKHPRPRPRGPSTEAWRKHKQIIWTLYIEESQSLSETMKIMEEKYDFTAT